jgi:hypothetical protein
MDEWGRANLIMRVSATTPDAAAGLMFDDSRRAGEFRSMADGYTATGCGWTTSLLRLVRKSSTS